MPTVASSRKRDNRSRRFAALEWCRQQVKRKGAQTCMFAILGGVTFGATAAGDVHGKGVKRCASPWACPVCAPTIAERRSQEIDTACASWMASGGSVWLLTATLRHQLGDDLDGLLAMLQAAWSRTWRWESPHYSTRAKTLGQITNADRVRPAWYVGQIRTIEVTYGDAGWHPHIHALVFVPGSVSGNDVAGDAGIRELRKRWKDSVEKLGGSTSVAQRRDKSGRLTSTGWDVRPVLTSEDVARYVTKVEGGWSAGREIAKADQKRHGVTPWMLLEQAVAGDLMAAGLYKVYERATRGHNRIVASPGLMAMCTDEEAAEAEPAGEIVAMVQLRADVWKQLLISKQAAELLSDLADLARGDLVEWRWPVKWLCDPCVAVAA